MKVLALALFLTATSGAAFAEGRKLVLYTSQPQTDAQQTVDAFRAKHPDIEVSFVRDGTPRILAKLRAEIEADRPQADILLLADSVTMEGLKKEGRLLAHRPANLSAYPADVHDADGFWFSTKLITTGIVYNAKAPFKPESWADLIRPEAKGQVALPSPMTSGAAMIHTVTLTSNLAEGWGYYRSLSANGALAAGGNGDILRQVAGGEKMFGMIVDFMPIREKAKGAPVEFVFPKEGVSMIGEPVAVLKTTKNEAAARAFVDFLLSSDGQELAKRQGYVPALASVGMPSGYPDRSALKVMRFDPAKALADDRDNKKRFGDIFGQ